MSGTAPSHETHGSAGPPYGPTCRHGRQPIGCDRLGGAASSSRAALALAQVYYFRLGSVAERADFWGELHWRLRNDSGAPGKKEMMAEAGSDAATAPAANAA